MDDVKSNDRTLKPSIFACRKSSRRKSRGGKPPSPRLTADGNADRIKDFWLTHPAKKTSWSFAILPTNRGGNHENPLRIKENLRGGNTSKEEKWQKKNQTEKKENSSLQYG